VLSISELARRSGLTTAALRFYERKGLLTPAGRTGRVRIYDDTAPDRVATVGLLQKAGFTLAEIARLIRPDGAKGRQWTTAVRDKLAELEHARADIDRARAMLRHALACPSPDITTCPYFLQEVRALAQRSATEGDPETEHLRSRS
jgi:DNA-binding transcriptional MerR regulator